MTAPEGHLRLYADAGRPVGALLRQIGGELRRGYVQRLLAILPQEARAAAVLAEPLTEREQQILALIATGCSNQDVARELFMGVSTVKWHLLNIFGKLQVRNRTEAVARARSLGLL